MTRQNHKILSILSILSVLLSAYYPIVIGRLHVWLCSASPTVINVGLTNKDPVVAFLWNMEPRAREVLGMWSALTWPVQSSTVCLRQDIGIISRALFQTNFF